MSDDRTGEENRQDAERRKGREPLAASDQAQNAEVVLDEDLDDAEPAQQTAEHVDRLEQHSERTDTPAHPESRGQPK